MRAGNYESEREERGKRVRAGGVAWLLNGVTCLTWCQLLTGYELRVLELY